MISYKVCKITAILERNLAAQVLAALEQAGHHYIYIQDGRAPLLAKSHNILTLFTGRKSLFSTPVKIVSLYTAAKHEQETLRLIASIAKLYRPGNGTVYSEPCHLFHTHENNLPKIVGQDEAPAIPFISDLMGICCIVQRGEADNLARVILQSGLGLPTIHFGTGTGLREKIGLLRVTIPAEKEVISLVVAKWDAPRVVETMIGVGRLHLPGRGFINTFPVNSGLLNTKLSLGPKYHAASIDQIIAAIDSLQGSIDWRRSADDEIQGSKRNYLDGADLHIICNAGQGVSLVRAAMAAGCPGATIEQLRMIQNTSAQNATPQTRMSPARERCKMMIKHNQVHVIIDAIRNAGAFTEHKQAVVLSQDVPQAFTYLRKGA